ncbi:zinc finger CW-type PWWP domain protein 1 isoform X12 [Ursus americanus]|uniref:zinc finger CW-type PWWP domain protein 1 isoform X10 n=1 Tax=Ursus arctos TaxID=9644 RepID=UPI001CF8DEE9|nr:zinc finger CW-type PWWP domain protein 1 isoform X10 [Ursus arctos]XP_045629816.1 zinc finger CW-type PWWP domain protein 1 isoform X12 [Ursus americanus]
MMTTLQSKEECGKGPKKTFAPPAQKLHSLMCYSPDPPKEETLGISSPKARLEKKEEKATTENGPSSGQENKGKPQDKQAEKKEKSKYHVTFFGETVSRAWIPVNMLKNFQELSLELAGGKKFRNKDCNQKLGAALTMAQEAERINIQERVNLFGFRSRYTGSDSSGEGKDLRLSGANSPDSCLEKEEEESELEAEELEEEEEKKALRKNLKLPKARPQ